MNLIDNPNFNFLNINMKYLDLYIGDLLDTKKLIFYCFDRSIKMLEY